MEADAALLTPSSAEVTSWASCNCSLLECMALFSFQQREPALPGSLDTATATTGRLGGLAEPGFCGWVCLPGQSCFGLLRCGLSVRLRLALKVTQYPGWFRGHDFPVPYAKAWDHRCVPPRSGNCIISRLRWYWELNPGPRACWASTFPFSNPRGPQGVYKSL